MNVWMQLAHMEWPFRTSTGAVDWMAMRDGIGEDQWRQYIAVNREVRSLSRL